MTKFMSVDEAVMLAHPTTKSIVLTGGMAHKENSEIYDLLDFEHWDDDEAFGPDCHFCGQVIVEIAFPFTYKGTKYTALFQDDLAGSPDDSGILQCVYCLNFFHKNKCNITCSDITFCNLFLSKDWACPNCVPDFISKLDTVLMNKQDNYKKLMRKLVKMLNPLRNQFDEMYYTIECFKHKYDFCINNFERYGMG